MELWDALTDKAIIHLYFKSGHQKNNAAWNFHLLTVCVVSLDAFFQKVTQFDQSYTKTLLMVKMLYGVKVVISWRIFIIYVLRQVKRFRYYSSSW